ncbi:MAG: LysR substrate-binding domain-containing protein [Bowdeniella nasicola]|nr:LysR substrate-binding domain-containing protein [Bowdeniella nasicola]
MRELDIGDALVLELLDHQPSLSAIARELAVSQSAISQRLARLEARCGSPLVVRSSGGITPLPLAFQLAHHARAALVQLDHVDALLTTPRAASGPRTVIAASLTIADHYLGSWLARLNTASQIDIAVGNSARTIARVRAGKADIGFVEGPHAPPGLVSWELGHDALVVATTPTTAARLATPLTPRGLCETNPVVREVGSGTRAVLDAALARAGLRLPVGCAVANSTTALLDAAARGAVVVVAEVAAVQQAPVRELTCIPTTFAMPRTLRMVTRPGAQLGVVATRFTRLVRAITASAPLGTQTS